MTHRADRWRENAVYHGFMTATASPNVTAAAAVTVTRDGEGTTQTAQTPGMRRRQIASVPGAWVGIAKTEPGVTSGWHSHDGYESFIYVLSGQIRMDFGHGGTDSFVATSGDLIHVPKGAIHREGNPGVEEQVVLVMRAGTGEPVTNTDCPAS
jgi:uncharacterized RmlC-like cupin family protein